MDTQVLAVEAQMRIPVGRGEVHGDGIVYLGDADGHLMLSLVDDAPQCSAQAEGIWHHCRNRGKATLTIGTWYKVACVFTMNSLVTYLDSEIYNECKSGE